MLNWNEPSDAIKYTRHSFFEHEANFKLSLLRQDLGQIFLTTQKSRQAEKNFHNARSLQENLARSGANQSAYTHCSHIINCDKTLPTIKNIREM